MSGRIVRRRRSSRRRPARILLGVMACVAISLTIGVIAVLQSVRLLAAETDWGLLPATVWAMRSLPIVWVPFFTWFAFALLLCMAAWTTTMIATSKLRGNAQWKQVGAIRQAKLHNEEAAMLLDRLTRTLRRLGGAEPPTPAGRGSGGAIPNLLTWPGSVIILDVDRENWERTAGFRSKHLKQQTLLFNPLDSAGHSCRYNPLGHINRHDPAEVIEELQKIGAMLLAPPRTGSRAWTERARTAFLGVAAYLAATVDDGEDALPFTIGEMARQFTAGDAKRRFPAIIRQREAAGRPLSGACVSALRDWCSSSDNQFASVRQTVIAEISLWLNPFVDAATAESDIDLRTVRDTRVSLYLAASQEDLERIAPLYNLLCQHLIDLNLRALPAGDRRRVPLLVFLDDAARLVRGSVLVSGDRDLAAYGMRIASSGQRRAASLPRDQPARPRSGAFGTLAPVPDAADSEDVLLLQQKLDDPLPYGGGGPDPLGAPHMLAIRPDPDVAAKSLRVIARAESQGAGRTAVSTPAPKPVVAPAPARPPADAAPIEEEDGLDRTAIAAAIAAPPETRTAALFAHIVQISSNAA